ncbi:MAG: metallophosphoesterase [Christensenellales bacterium]|jgi:3',5'-cyclic AMP phosphodiesterase CpdA|nr:hypothetical protein [Clostridiales bacterium]
MDNTEKLENGQPEKGKKNRFKIKPLDKSPEAKKRRKKIALIVIISIISAILLVVIITAIGSAIVTKTLPKYAQSFGGVSYSDGEQLVPEKDTDGYWTFVTDDEFKVVQLTDIHLGGGLFSATTDKKVLNAIAAMVTAEKPDLVIATGDIAYPVPFSAGTSDNKKAAKAFADLMDSLGVYWTVTFGNHDTEVYSKYTREQISDFYSGDQYKYSLFSEGPENIDGFGNSIIKIKNSAGFVTRAIVTLDSHSYLPSDKFGLKWEYDNIHNSQTTWYKTEMAKLKAANQTKFDALPEGEQVSSIKIDVPSSLYFHIPIKEYKDAWMEYYDNDSKDIAGVVELKYGRIGETGKLIYHGVGEDNVFDTMVEAGGDSVFCGHDHYNNISINYWKTEEQIKPIRLTYGVSLDYLAYPGIASKGAQRGCTVIVYDGADIDITPENYYQSKYRDVAKYKVEKVKIVEEHIPRK